LDRDEEGRAMTQLAASAVEDEEFLVVSRTRRTPVIMEVELQPVGEPLHYLPGQYVLVSDQDCDMPVRSYSVANAPEDSGRISLLVTEVVSGLTSSWLTRGVQIGGTVLVSGPYGSFVADAGVDTPTLGLAGGSGLAPIRALAQDAVRRPIGQPFTVLFSARTEIDVMDRERFAQWERQYAGFRFVRTLTRSDGTPPVGRIPEILSTLFADLSDHEVFVAGPPRFVADCTQSVRQLGVHPGHLHTEEFFAEPQPWSSPSTTEAPA